MRTSTISAAASGRPAACDLLDALEQHLPGARQHAHRQLCGESAPARALGFGERNVVGQRRHDLEAGDEMRELGEIAEHHRRIGAGVVLLAQLGQRARHVGAHQRLEQIDDRGCGRRARASARTSLGAHRTRGMRDRLVEQRQRVAHRAFGGARDQRQRLGLGRDRFLAGDALQMLAPAPRHRRGADRSAGSATAP